MKEMKWLLWVLLGCVLVVIGIMFLEEPETKMVFMDVGQGDSILFESGTIQILIDGGEGLAVLSRLGEEMPYFDNTIDVIISTHPDRDHLEGLAHVLGRYKVGLVLLPQVRHTSLLQEEWLNKLQALVVDRKTEYRFAYQGERISAANLDIDILGPSSSMVDAVNKNGQTNNASVATRITIAGLRFLLTGDAESGAEKQLVADTSGKFLDIDILKAGHHGSKTSSSIDLLKAATPRAVVISVGTKNKYGHPSKEIIDRYESLSIPIYRTDQLGSIAFVYKQGRWLLICRQKSCNDI